MTALIFAVFIASLFGSMHCAGMCGAFLTFALASNEASPAASRTSLHVAYNGGRLVTYMTLGAIGGSVGAMLNLGGSMIGVQRFAAIVAGALMVAFGVVAILRLRGVHVPKLPLPSALQQLVARGHRLAFEMPPIARATIIGLLTTLLPCGWLYAFVITAAGTAHPALGALTMAAFWLGTLPVMISLGIGVQRLSGALRSRLPLLTSLLIVAVGLYTIAGRMTLPAMALSTDDETVPTTTAEAIEHVKSLDTEKLPCCHDH